MAKRNTQRADGRFEVAVYLGVDEETGKKIYKHCYGNTQQEADEKALQLKIEMDRGIDISANDTFKVWAERWLKNKKTEVSASWFINIKTHVNYVVDEFGHIEIKKIEIAHIKDLLNRLAEKNPNTGKPSSKNLVKNIRNTASQILNFAIENRVMDFNPAKYVKLPKSAKPTKRRRPLTEQEISWVENTEHRAKPAAMIMMHAGLRLGELIPLQWNDIDLDEKTISVVKSVEMIDSRYVVKEGTKGGEEEENTRVVDIPNKLVNYLYRLKKETILVCPRVNGAMHTGTSWRSMWSSYLGELNRINGDFTFLSKPKSKFTPGGTPFVIQRITPHMLRHTFCTLMYKAGVDVLTAAAQMGHKDIRVTLAIYTHLDKIYKRKSMSKMDEYLSDRT